jgi:hypothetical protein
VTLRSASMSRFITGKRRQRRTKMVAPLRFRIIGKGGNQETDLAHTLDVSNHGVRLAGFRCDLKAGDVIELQYRHKRARFRVVWIAIPEGLRERHLGAECVEPEKDIWGVELSEKPDEYEEKD